MTTEKWLYVVDYMYFSGNEFSVAAETTIHNGPSRSQPVRATNQGLVGFIKTRRVFK